MKTYIIAELGINHNGDTGLCKDMIKSAQDLGADAVKIQINNPKNISFTKWLIEVQEKTRLSLEQMEDISHYAASIGMELFSSVGDVTALNDFVRLPFKRIKISSSNLLNAPLHERVSRLGIPVIVSTGDADLNSIEKVIAIYARMDCDLTLLHCIPRYPTPIEECTLGAISFLKKSFSVPIGFSDHTLGSEAAVAAVAMGATVIEKHFTLNKGCEGPDHYFSANPEEFGQLVKQIRRVEKMFGNPEDLYSVRALRRESLVRRALVFKKSHKAGTIVRSRDIIVARPILQVENFINPLDYAGVIGKTLAKDVQPFEAITYEHIVGFTKM